MLWYYLESAMQAILMRTHNIGFYNEEIGIFQSKEHFFEKLGFCNFFFFKILKLKHDHYVVIIWVVTKCDFLHEILGKCPALKSMERFL